MNVLGYPESKYLDTAQRFREWVLDAADLVLTRGSVHRLSFSLENCSYLCSGGRAQAITE